MVDKLKPFLVHGKLENPMVVSAEEILNAIKENRDIDVEYTVIEGDLDIRKPVDQNHQIKDEEISIKSNIKIQNSKLRGKISFIRAVFDGNINFNGTIFEDIVSFGGAEFKVEAHFCETTFVDVANFKKCTFIDDAFFHGTTFSSIADFNEATFKAFAGFGNPGFPLLYSKRTTFSFIAEFDDVNFHGYAEFSFVVFKTAIFRCSKFIDTAYFASAVFEGNADFSFVNFGRNAYFNLINFEGMVLFFKSKFNGIVSFIGTTSKRPINFADVKFHEDTVLITLWNRICRPLIYPIVLFLTFGKWKLLKKQITEFTDFNTSTLMDSSSNLYLRRYIDDEQWLKSWYNRSWWRKLFYFFWIRTSHCGRSFSLWMFWVLAVIAVFGFIYADYYIPCWLPKWLEQILSVMDPKINTIECEFGRIPTLFTPYYFSFVTFTTLGFGDIKPINLAGEIWVAIEVTIGYIMLGGLISIFTNTFARRS